METLSILLSVPASMAQHKMPLEMNSTTWFIIGSVVALFLFVYLTFTLIKPEKF